MTASTSSLVEVALPLPILRTFSYRAPAPVAEGVRVLVPFNREERIGWVVGAPSHPPGGTRLRAVLSVLDVEPSVTPEVLALCRWMAGYYATPLGIALRSALPAVLTDVSHDYVAVAGEPPRALRPREARLVAALEERAGRQRVRALRKALGMGSIWPEIRALTAAGVLHHETVPPPPPSVRTRRVARLTAWIGTLEERDGLFGRARRQREAYDFIEAAGGAVELSVLTGRAGFSRGVVRGLEEKGLVALADEEVMRDPFADDAQGEPSRLVVTEHQRAALEALLGALDEVRPAPFLLQGVTGSGKTLVYVELLEEVLARCG